MKRYKIIGEYVSDGATLKAVLSVYEDGEMLSREPVEEQAMVSSPTQIPLIVPKFRSSLVKKALDIQNELERRHKKSSIDISIPADYQEW